MNICMVVGNNLHTSTSRDISSRYGPENKVTLDTLKFKYCIAITLSQNLTLNCYSPLLRLYCFHQCLSVSVCLTLRAISSYSFGPMTVKLHWNIPYVNPYEGLTGSSFELSFFPFKMLHCKNKNSQLQQPPTPFPLHICTEQAVWSSMTSSFLKNTYF